VVRKGVRAGRGIAETLGETGLFDADFQAVLYTAEEAGRMSEVMRQQAKYYEEIAGQRLALLMRAAGFAVWAAVAILIVIAIIRIYMMYIGMLNQF
jgi:type II secretory pathway component PulF